LTTAQPVEQRGPAGFCWVEAGEGEPIVFLHGLGGSATAWGPQLDTFSQRFRCLAWDMPGYGRTPIELLQSEPAQIDFAIIADAIVAFMDDAKLDTATFVGLSFGGQQLLHLALRHPNKVSRLIVADSSAAFGADGTDPDEWMRLRLDPLDSGLQPGDIAERVIDAITGPNFGGSERQAAIDAFARVTADGLRAAVHCLPNHDVTERLAQITAPTLIIVGELDEETPPAYSEVMAKAIPGAELVTIPGVGHLTPSEAPDAFNSAVDDFIARR
jgi:3-oxoadipate enol-lactonase